MIQTERAERALDLAWSPLRVVCRQVWRGLARTPGLLAWHVAAVFGIAAVLVDFANGAAAWSILVFLVGIILVVRLSANPTGRLFDEWLVLLEQAYCGLMFVGALALGAVALVTGGPLRGCVGAALALTLYSIACGIGLLEVPVDRQADHSREAAPAMTTRSP